MIDYTIDQVHEVLRVFLYDIGSSTGTIILVHLINVLSTW